MKSILIFFLFMITSICSYSQVQTEMLDAKDVVTKDSSQAVTYAVYGKVSGDSVYTFKKFDFSGILLTSGSFKDDSLTVPHGVFTYYNWITPQNNYANDGYEIDGKERFVEVTGSFLNGKRQGRWITFYSNGKIKQVITFYQGILHGGFQAFDIRGKVEASGMYTSGKKNGTWVMDGGKREDVYVNDELVSSLRGKKLRDKQAQGKITN